MTIIAIKNNNREIDKKNVFLPRIKWKRKLALKLAARYHTGILGNCSGSRPVAKLKNIIIIVWKIEQAGNWKSLGNA